MKIMTDQKNKINFNNPKGHFLFDVYQEALYKSNMEKIVSQAEEIADSCIDKEV